METLIQFKTAELAKEKGYNINTYSNCWVKTTDNKIIHNSERDDMNYLHDRVTTHLFQPSQSALQKWLREVHNIDVFVVPNAGIQNEKIYCCHVKKDNVYVEGEDGLFEALKLIP